MASVLTVQDAVSFCSPFIAQQKLNIQNFQPGLGIAQIILSTMLGPPMVWRFNRANLQLPISTAGGTDYVQGLAGLGNIETQWLTDGSGNIFELNGAVVLAKSGTQRRPVKVAPQYDDNQGHITFRFDSVPDQSYTAYFDYQQKAALIDSWAKPLVPIPDEYAHIFLKGFLAWCGALVKDARFPIWENEFITALLSTQSGMDEQARNIFLGNWMELTKTVGRATASAQAAVAARGKQ